MSMEIQAAIAMAKNVHRRIMGYDDWELTGMLDSFVHNVDAQKSQIETLKAQVALLRTALLATPPEPPGMERIYEDVVRELERWWAWHNGPRVQALAATAEVR